MEKSDDSERVEIHDSVFACGDNHAHIVVKDLKLDKVDEVTLYRNNSQEVKVFKAVKPIE